jgi:serine protease Do
MKTDKRRFVRLTFAVLVVFLSPLLVAVGVLPAAAQVPTDHQAQTVDRPILSLRDLNQAFIDIAAAVKPTVVTVSTERVMDMRRSPFGGSPFASDPFLDFFFGGPRNRQRQEPDREFKQQGLGSGVIVSADGRILTNNHVVDQADSIWVRTFEGKRFPATVIGVDPQTDIAVIKISTDQKLPFITVGNSDELKVGEMVLAVGSPMSENLAYTVTQGIVSAKGRSNVGLADYEDYIQTDAAINPGNSGGPLVNLDGELIGINSAIASQSGGFQGIGFAVPSNMAIRIMNSLVADGKVVRGWLGVTIQDVDDQLAKAMDLPESSGALVGDVMEGSPAAKAGIEAGDVVVAVNDRPITTSGQLRSQVASTAPGIKVDLKVMRGEKPLTIPVMLGELPDNLTGISSGGSIERQLNFAVGDLNNDLADRYGISGRAQGVVVTSIDQNSAAFAAGLREGDLILSVNRQRIQSEKDFSARVGDIEDGATVLLRVVRQNSGFFIAFNK